MTRELGRQINALLSFEPTSAHIDRPRTPCRFDDPHRIRPPLTEDLDAASAPPDKTRTRSREARRPGDKLCISVIDDLVSGHHGRRDRIIGAELRAPTEGALSNSEMLSAVRVDQDATAGLDKPVVQFGQGGVLGPPTQPELL